MITVKITEIYKIIKVKKFKLTPSVEQKTNYQLSNLKYGINLNNLSLEDKIVLLSSMLSMSLTVFTMD